MTTARMDNIASTKETAREALGAAAQAVVGGAATKARAGDSRVTAASAAAVVKVPQHLHHRHNSSSCPSLLGAGCRVPILSIPLRDF